MTTKRRISMFVTLSDLEIASLEVSGELNRSLVSEIWLCGTQMSISLPHNSGNMQDNYRPRTKYEEKSTSVRSNERLTPPPHPWSGPGQGYPFPRARTRAGVPPPPPTAHAIDRIHRGWYASCGHIGGLFFFQVDELQ